ncbi:MAG: hypothetical protein J0I21_01360 [Alphaproteobacteria bacterium]|nr:hypothetical protein [Alphaproteobacteria bacterium]
MSGGGNPGGGAERRAFARVVAPLLARVRGGARTTPPARLARALAPATRMQTVQRLHHFPPFRPADYLALNPDAARARADPASHALFVGAGEGRTLFQPERLARLLRAPQPHDGAIAAPHDAVGASAELAVGLYVSSHGNVFMREIVTDLAADLTAAGIAVTVGDETAPIAARPARAIFVAPHEFFTLGAGPRWIREEVVAHAVMLNTEQAQTRWFALALPFLLASRGVIDLNAQMAALLGASGLPALHLTMAPPLAPALTRADREHALFRALPDAAHAAPQATTPLAARPIDIAFFGATSPHRDAFFARHAAFFADYATLFHCRPIGRGPIHAEGAEGGLARLAQHVGGHAKLVLNLHRDEYGYFEWHRIVRLGLCAGSVVVSEPCLPHPLFRAGTHYFEAPAEEIPRLIEWLLRTDDGRAAAQAAQDNARRLTETFSPARTATAVTALLRDG